MVRKQKLATFNVDPDIWERFKSKCLESGSNASAELVAFINRALDGEESTGKTGAVSDHISIENAIEQYLDKHIDRYLDRYNDRISQEKKAIDHPEIETHEPEPEPLPILSYIEKISTEEPPTVTVETYAICQCQERAIVSFWTGGGWSKDLEAAKVYLKEGTAKTQVVRLQKGNHDMEIRYNSIERIQAILDRVKEG